jgi:hypothetical protein
VNVPGVTTTVTALVAANIAKAKGTLFMEEEEEVRCCLGERWELSLGG